MKKSTPIVSMGILATKSEHVIKAK